MRCEESLGTTGRDTDISLRVVQKVADELDVSPREVEPIYESIDPDALNQLIRTTTDQNVRVEFTVAGCTVVVYGTGAVEVTGPTAASDQETHEESDGDVDSRQDRRGVYEG